MKETINEFLKFRSQFTKREWIELVKERIEKRGWSQTDLAIVVGVSPSAITQLLKDGKGSDDLKLRINKKLRISESWERFEE
ncbi:helix-turn-helix transcriptional regulator [Streptococcus infantis]|uniref:helix-turn-helix domain-containing protein n=1 Tax=Streptococcus infantis TaxID=68892 RepID=UPI0039C04D92